MNKKTLVLVHGWGGTHSLHWQNWLKQKALESKKMDVVFPLMPNYDLPSLSEWLSKLKQTVFDHSHTILIGHSLGCPTILHYLEQLQRGKKVLLVILVAGFARPLDIPEIDGFVSRPFNWEKIKKSADKFVVIFSDNDPFISVKESTYLSDSLEVKPIVQKSGGHITAPDFGPYDRIWEIILGKN